MNEWIPKQTSHVHKGEKPLDKRLMNEINKVQLEQISGKDYPITNQIYARRNARATWIPPINSRNFLVMKLGVGDTGEAKYLTQTNNPYIQLYPSINT